MEDSKQLKKPYVMIAPYAAPFAKIEEQQQQQQPMALDSQLFNGLINNNRCLNQQIKGPGGSVRGHRDVVKRSLENISRRQRLLGGGRNSFGQLTSFMSSPAAAAAATTTTTTPKQQVLKQMDEQRASYLSRLAEEEQDQCVAYTTTLGIIRRTFEDSKQMRSILDLNLIRYEERDIYLNEDYKYQLRMRCSLIKVPVLFVDGQLVGGIKELELLNESGKLCLLLAKFKVSILKMSKASADVCLCCGNAKFIACPTCNGSRRSAIHHFKFNSIALRCIRCHRNDGLVQCPLCSTTISSPSTYIKTSTTGRHEPRRLLLAASQQCTLEEEEQEDYTGETVETGGGGEVDSK